jgi:hypothetical protein
VVFDCRPTRGRQNQDGQLSDLEVLLILQVLVGGNEHIESSFCSSQEIPVTQVRPSHLERSGDGMTGQDLAQGGRGALIKEDSQRVRVSSSTGLRLDQTVFGVRQDSDDLLVCDTGKPFQEIVQTGSTLKIFEQGAHRHTCSLEHPGPTDLSGNALDRAALTPLQHWYHCSLLKTAGQGLLPHAATQLKR